eukprot:TRINITY_DN4201_c0_g1_i1.p1 TRINITY_DN4201_c0_g1~~TRINITY_DN4201_c0_g1_i1.p1  ORF type:complete len:550 (+),score=121.84 TRINITY_DN4201_c0_g1_i1:57-1706(+)
MAAKVIHGHHSEDEEEGPSVTNNHRTKADLMTADEKERELMKDNCCGRLASDLYFQNTTLVVIVINAIWMFVDVEWNHQSLQSADGVTPLDTPSLIVENVFCSYFVIEIAIRALAFKSFWVLATDAWFLCDFFLVLLMVLETWVLPIVSLIMNSEQALAALNFSSLRLIRLLRLTRMARIMRFFPELMTLVKGMVRAMQSVFFILMFLVIVTYIFAIVFTSQLGDPATVPAAPDEDPNAAQLFSDLGSSMMTLFTHGVLGDNLAWCLITVKADSLPLFWAFLLFFAISGITLLNMLIGVLCQVIADSSAEEEEMQQVMSLRACLEDAFEAGDDSGDGIISEDEFIAMRSNPRVLDQFLKLGADKQMMQEKLDQMQEVLFGVREDPSKEAEGDQTSPHVKPDSANDEQQQRRSLSFDEFVEQVIALQMDATCGTTDVELLKSKIQKSDARIKQRLDRLEPLLRHATGSENEERTTIAIQKPEEHEALHDGSPQEENIVQSVEDEDSDEAAVKTWVTPEGLELREDWLQKVPSELLFYVLKARAGPPVMMS